MQKIQIGKTILSACTLLGCSAVSANSAPTLAPISDMTVVVGEQIDLRVVPEDVDGHVPSLRIIDIPDGALFSDNGDGTRSFKWLPQSYDQGQVKVTFEAIDAQDQSLRNGRSMTITVVAGEQQENTNTISGNLAPEFESLVDREIQLGNSFDFRVVPYDPEGIVPALRVENLPAGANLDDNRDGTRQFRWTPSAAQIGEFQVSFVAYEESNIALSTTRAITLTVNDSQSIAQGTEIPASSNQSAPQFVDLNDQFVYLGQQLNLVVQAKSEDGSVPGLALDRMPVDSSFNDNGDGTRTFNWFPYPVNLGDTYVSVIAIDAYDSSIRTDQTIKITVERDPNNPVNFPPVINGIQNPTIRVGDTLNQLVQPVDPDFTVPSLIALDLPSDALFVDNGDGTRDVRWTVDASDLGDHTFSFRVTDSEDASLQFESSFTVSVVEASSLERRGERLRTLADRRDFLIGYASPLNAGSKADNELFHDIAAEEFNMVTPENSHKMGWIQPQRGEFEWDDADELADFAIENGMVLHGHPLVWYAQLPGWVQLMDTADAQVIMNEHINAMVSRYLGKVAVWDVVNEAINDVDGQLRESVWYQGMGEGYISEAFRTAHAADPDAQLIYNDYDVAWYNTKSNAMYELLKRELAAGTPIDGVGFQMHLGSDFTDFDGMRSNLQRFADLELDIYITEFDVALNGDDNEDRQAEVYRRTLEICLAQSNCKAMQSWGYTDRYSWRSSSKPLLLTDKYIAKPSYYTWQTTLRDYLR